MITDLKHAWIWMSCYSSVLIKVERLDPKTL
jgi:hypothetical protein